MLDEVSHTLSKHHNVLFRWFTMVLARALCSHERFEGDTVILGTSQGDLHMSVMRVTRQLKTFIISIQVLRGKMTHRPSKYPYSGTFSKAGSSYRKPNICIVWLSQHHFLDGLWCAHKENVMYFVGGSLWSLLEAKLERLKSKTASKVEIQSGISIHKTNALYVQ